MITSAQNPKVKLLLELQEKSKTRRNAKSHRILRQTEVIKKEHHAV